MRLFTLWLIYHWLGTVAEGRDGHWRGRPEEDGESGEDEEDLDAGRMTAIADQLVHDLGMDVRPTLARVSGRFSCKNKVVLHG